MAGERHLRRSNSSKPVYHANAVHVVESKLRSTLPERWQLHWLRSLLEVSQR